LRALTELTRLFDGKVVDVSSDSVIIELCAKSSRLSSFMKLCKPFGILEASRTGKFIFTLGCSGCSILIHIYIYTYFLLGIMAMPRSPVHDHYEPQTEHSYEDSDSVDASLLPPG
jgi:acetolactate synthase-1/3 small subunit